MNKEIAIKVENLSKTFRIPHEKISSLRGAFVSAFRRDKGYEEFEALNDVSFEVKKGEFFGIIGRNGSGKSTLLKILAGIYQPDKGKVKVNGLISPFLELGIGFNPELSGRDNVYLNAAVLGLTHKQIEEKFDDIVEFSELRRFIDQKVKNYSSGMQVRLMFSVAIHANRDILLMDEVLAVGDVNFQQKCIEEFKKYRNQGKTVVLVTHDIGTVQKYCDRVILLRNGKTEIIGNPMKVVAKYIYQNMSDEEKNILEEEKRKKETAEKKNIGKKAEEKDFQEKGRNELVEFGNKNITVEKVEIVDENGGKRNSFYPGDYAKIIINYKVKKDVRKPHFGIGVKDSEGNFLCSTNHLRENMIIESFSAGKSGSVECEIPRIPFLSGTHYLSVFVYGDKMETNPLPIHHLENIKKFRITNNNSLSDDGKILIDCKWTIS